MQRGVLRQIAMVMRTLGIGGTAGERLAKSWLVVVLLSGWFVASFGELGLNVWLPIIASIGLILIIVTIILKDSVFSRGDLRWLFVPAFAVILGWIDPLWSSPMQWDQADHLQTANRYLGRWSWEPFHQDMDFSFRPKIMSGLLAIEMGLTGRRYEVDVVPFACLVACGWQIQALAERGNRLLGGVIAAAVVLSLPTMLVFGRTGYLEALATGGLVMTFRIALDALNDDFLNRADYIGLGIVASLVGAVKYPYLYLGISLPICIWAMNRHRNEIPVFLGSWILFQLPFLVSDLIDHGSPFASFEPQALGVVNSMTEEVGNYSLAMAIADISAEIGFTLLVCFLTISGLWIRQDTLRRFPVMASIALPSVVIFAVVLDFGYSRYHLPWLSVLICVTCNWVFQNLESLAEEAKINTEIAGSFLVMLLLSHHVTSVVADSLENRERNLSVIQYRERYLDEFIEIGNHLPTDAVVLAGFDITLGVRFGVPTYRFGPSDDPIHDSIEVVDATHVIIGGGVSRFDWESDPLYILGAPIDPLASSSREVVYASLWATNSTRGNYHRSASMIDVDWSSGHEGDVFLASGGVNVSAPDDWSIIEIIDLRDKSSTGKEAMDMIFGKEGDATLICDGEGCMQEFLVPEGTRYLVKVGLSDED